MSAKDISLPDDSADAVVLLPQHQHPFGANAKIDRRVQSVFFHYNAAKAEVLKFCDFVGLSLMEIRLADPDRSEGREMFNDAIKDIPEAVRFDPNALERKPKGLVDSLSKYFTPGVKRTSRTALSSLLKPQVENEDGEEDDDDASKENKDEGASSPPPAKKQRRAVSAEETTMTKAAASNPSTRQTRLKSKEKAGGGVE